jgi:hypothetical protein
MKKLTNQLKREIPKYSLIEEYYGEKLKKNTTVRVLVLSIGRDENYISFSQAVFYLKSCSSWIDNTK